MKTITLLAGFLSFLLVSSCGDKDKEADKGGKKDSEEAGGGTPKEDTVESLADEMGDHLEFVATTMSKVTDLESAKSAAAEVKAKSGKLGDIASRLGKLPEPAAEVKKAIEEKMKNRNAAMKDRIGSRSDLMDRLDPDSKEVVDLVMSDFMSELLSNASLFENYFEAGDEEPEVVAPSSTTTPDPAPDPEPEVAPPSVVPLPGSSVAPGAPNAPSGNKPVHPATTVPTPNVPPALPTAR